MKKKPVHQKYLGIIGTESNHFNFGKLVSITTDGEILNKILK
jgi:hypothetical protein